MKNLLLLSILLLLFGCEVNGQDYSNDLGITSPKSFSTFIKSLESNSNLLSEGQGYKEYKKIITKNTKTFTIRFMVTYDKTKNMIPLYQGEIDRVESNNGKMGIPYTISRFRYSTYNNLIIGDIRFNITTKNIENYYSSIYGFVIKKENQGNEEVESEEEEKTPEEKNESIKYTFFGTRSNRGSGGYVTEINLIPEFYTIGEYSILSEPILYQEENFWENNGNLNSRGNGYSITINEKTMIPTDTLSYVYYKNGKKNGPIKNYMFKNNRKLKMEIGTFKDGISVGEYTKFTLTREKKDRVLERKILSDQNGSFIHQEVYNYTYKTDIPFPIPYVQTSINYNPKTHKMNGEYQTYYSVIVDGESILEESGFYTEDKRTGIWKKYYENGQLNELIDYTTGQSEKYERDGTLIYKKYKN